MLSRYEPSDGAQSVPSEDMPAVDWIHPVAVDLLYSSISQVYFNTWRIGKLNHDGHLTYRVSQTASRQINSLLFACDIL
jgi:hypothetical protein